MARHQLQCQALKLDDDGDVLPAGELIYRYCCRYLLLSFHNLGADQTFVDKYLTTFNGYYGLVTLDTVMGMDIFIAARMT